MIIECKQVQTSVRTQASVSNRIQSHTITSECKRVQHSECKRVQSMLFHPSCIDYSIAAKYILLAASKARRSILRHEDLKKVGEGN